MGCYSTEKEQKILISEEYILFNSRGVKWSHFWVEIEAELMTKEISKLYIMDPWIIPSKS